MWELDYKEVWAPKNWCFQTVVLEKTPESPLDCKEIKPSNPKENPPWIFIGRADAEAEAPILGPPDVKSRLTEKDPDAGKDWKQKEKGTSEGEVVGWHHWLNGHEFEQTLGEMFVYTRSIKICGVFIVSLSKKKREEITSTPPSMPYCSRIAWLSSNFT